MEIEQPAGLKTCVKTVGLLRGEEDGPGIVNLEAAFRIVDLMGGDAGTDEPEPAAAGGE
jgi:hypothetical protein